MSGLPQRQRMREALQLTERNLSSLIAARHPDAVLMSDWRTVVCRALGHWIEPRECICPKCGIRHGLSQTGGF